MATQQPCTKKRKVTQNLITLVDTFHIQSCQLQPLVKSAKCNLVPLVSKKDQRPVLVQLNGGGVIPRSFGVEVKDVDGGQSKVVLAVQVDSMSDHQHLERLRTELSEEVAIQWKTWFPDVTTPSKEVLMNFCNNFVSPRKKKTSGEGTWSGVTKASIDLEDIRKGRCKVVDKETGEIIPYDRLPGMNWHKVVFELRYVFIQATKSYGITKKLRYILCSCDEDEAELEPL
jgi:hypothetical protein